MLKLESLNIYATLTKGIENVQYWFSWAVGVAVNFWNELYLSMIYR